MAIMTIRDKNQVTLPAALLKQVGLHAGAPVEFSALSDGGIGIYPYGVTKQRESAWDAVVRLAKAHPGIEDAELELPPRDLAVREVEW